jgi:formate dehydrogenase subunit delta
MPHESDDEIETHPHSTNERLVMMANQIGRFFAYRGETRAVADIANHLKQFWDPRMRRGILAYLDAGGGGLDPFPLQAVRRLADETTKEPRQP